MKVTVVRRPLVSVPVTRAPKAAVNVTRRPKTGLALAGAQKRRTLFLSATQWITIPKT